MSAHAMSHRMTRTTLTILSILFAGILFFCVNLISALTLRSHRLDLTENRLFTVSDSTRRILSGLKEPITLKIYQSQELLDSVPRLRIYADRVNEMLLSYQDIAGGKLRIERINPVPFSAEEDRALGYGLRGFALDRTGERGYFGLVGTNSLDGLETIEFLSPDREPFLEYDLSRAVHRLATVQEPTVGIIDGLNMFGSREENRRPWAVLDAIDKSFRILPLEQNTKAIPEVTDVLMVAHPDRLSPSTRYAIDQFALAGGAIALFIDPLAENSPPNPVAAKEGPKSDLNDVTRKWGIELSPGKVVGDRAMALRVTASAGRQKFSVEYLPWLQVREDAFSGDDVTTAQLRIMRMSTAGALRLAASATTTVTPLIQTTPDSMLFDEPEIWRHPNPNTLLEKFAPTAVRQTLAARVRGIVETAFPEGPPADEGTAGAAQTPQIRRSVKPLNAVIVADTDLLADSHVVGERGQPISSNTDFVINVLENLAGGDTLIGLRGKGLSVRPFTKVEEIEARAEASYRATEHRLSNELEETQHRLAELLGPAASAGAQASSQEQQETVARFNRQLIDLRQQLREVRAALRREIDQLELRVKLGNIMFVPMVVVLAAIGVALVRRKRLARHLRGHQAA